MPISNKLDVSEVDVIIAGGGTAGCVLAGRLAAADPSLEILVIEGGENNYDKENVINPSLYPQHLLPDAKTAIFYKGLKTPQLGDRDMVIPSGGLLGGGSSINFMLYTRAQRSELDAINMPGWSANELLPFLKKLETFHPATTMNVPGTSLETHGDSGPVHISDGGFRMQRPMDEFIQGCAAIGYPELPDLQNLDACNGMQRWWRNVSLEGKRQDAAHCYVHPLLQDGKHPNLHVLTESKVEKVLFDNNKKASGVAFIPNPQYDPAETPEQVVKARKLVVVSCGACGTPEVIERSGIGGKAVLDKAGVPVVEDLPGVGEEYQDHNLIFYPYITDLKPSETNDQILSGRYSTAEALGKGDPLMKWNANDVAGKVRPTEAEVDALGPEFRAAWDRDFKNAPDRPLMLLALIGSYLGDQNTVPAGQYHSVACYTAYPYSRGYIHIKGPKWTDEYDFNTGFFSDKDDIDLKKQVWAYKTQREAMRRTKFYRGELAVGHPAFPAGSKAACINLEGTDGLTGEIKNLEYSEEDDKAIIQYLRENINTTWHSLGSAKMGRRENGGVVDENLNVYGVSGLKICDLSIIPENVAANTCNTAFLTGEKGADIVLKEFGLVDQPLPRLNFAELGKEKKRPSSRTDSVLSQGAA